MNDQNKTADLVEAAAKAYVYGFPLVYNLEEIEKYVNGSGSWPFSSPYNTFGHARDLIGADTKFVSPNNDTLYMNAGIDLSNGPLVLDVPDMHGRYYVLQFIDAWTNNFAYIGTRPSGTAAGKYLITSEDYDGEVPKGMTVIPAPSNIFFLFGRIQVNGEADLPAVRALQDEFTLEPLHHTDSPLAGMPVPDPRVPEGLKWWEAFRVALFAYAPPAAEADIVKSLQALGLVDGESPYVDADPQLAAILEQGKVAGMAKVEELARGGSLEAVNGWNSGTHLFDYNTHRLGFGTIDSPEWKMSDKQTAFAMRTLVARVGLWGNHGYEAFYAMAWVDADGDPLDGGKHRYELHFDTQPPTDAFWSLTMYDSNEFYLVANEINRYSIGDRTEGLVVEEDGSVTIYVQKDKPSDPVKAANWLPAPDATFRPLIRVYLPREEILTGEYATPAFLKVD